MRSTAASRSAASPQASSELARFSPAFTGNGKDALVLPPSNFLLLGLKDILWLHLKGYRVRTLSGASCSNAFGAAGMAASAGPNASTNDAGGVLEPDAGSAVRVLVECGDGEGRQWRTVAVSSSVLDAFVLAYSDALIWRLLQA